jgi:hypothetical protein
MTDTNQASDIQIISPAEARAALEAAIIEWLGEGWQTQVDGWVVVDRGDFHARLNRGRVNLDFYVDLLGAVRIEESGIDAAQEYGRILALMFLAGSILAAILIAYIAGYL